MLKKIEMYEKQITDLKAEEEEIIRVNEEKIHKLSIRALM
jgi:hypothetical protein